MQCEKMLCQILNTFENVHLKCTSGLGTLISDLWVRAGSVHDHFGTFHGTCFSTNSKFGPLRYMYYFGTCKQSTMSVHTTSVHCIDLFGTTTSVQCYIGTLGHASYVAR